MLYCLDPAVLSMLLPQQIRIAIQAEQNLERFTTWDKWRDSRILRHLGGIATPGAVEVQFLFQELWKKTRNFYDWPFEKKKQATSPAPYLKEKRKDALRYLHAGI